MTDLTGNTVGFIGMGLMGRPMCENLLAADLSIIGHNRSQLVIEELTVKGLNPASSPNKVAQASDIIILMLSDTNAVENVLVGKDGILEGIRDGALIIDMGTTAVQTTRELAYKTKNLGGEYLDAPVSGGAVGARNGSLSIMAGGSAKSFKRAMPILDILGKNINHIGDVGAGQIAKMVNQVIVGLTIGAVSEALVLAEASGADPEKVRKALMGGFATSSILELHGQRMINGNFDPGGRSHTQRKDLFEAQEFAEGLGLQLPALKLNLGLYDELLEKGWGHLDHSALYKLIKSFQESLS